MNNSAPLATRKQVAIFGKTNAGKSTLFNMLLGQNLSIISPVAGTTTDPVVKAMELLPFGPIALIDTAGLFDNTVLGELRGDKTDNIRRRTDVGVFVADICDFDEKTYYSFMKDIPHILVFNRCKNIEKNDLDKLSRKFSDAIFFDDLLDKIEELRKKIIEQLSLLGVEEEPVINAILSPGDTIIMVVPIDSAAPKGRLILPQVQILRQCLDHGVKCMVVRPEELKQVVEELKNVSLVVTDSQAFKEVAQIVPKNIALTSFSMLFAYSKGDFTQLLDGEKALYKLSDKDKVLMLEGCTHNKTHEDIGRVKIPALIKKVTGKVLEYDFVSGYDFPKNMQDYSFVIQCGSCMLNKREVLSRLKILADNQIPVSNYGIVLASLSGILDRASEILRQRAL